MHWLKPGRQLRRRNWVFRRLLFPRIDYFWYIGTENREFFRHYGVPEHKLIAVPYCVDNARFQAAAAVLLPQKNMLRQRMGLPVDAKIILFSGKLVAKKRPMDLLQAFHRLGMRDACLIFMGDGALRTAMEDYLRMHALSNVFITGFVNQSGVSAWSAAADLFVMCSGAGETWGLSVNEAMNFALPLVLSDQTGCASDLCVPGANGYIFPTGDVNALHGALSEILSLPAEQRAQMGEYSLRLVAGFSYETILQSLDNNLPA